MKVTKEIVEKVKSYLSDDKYSSLNNDELALLCSTSASSVSRIANGQYDHLLKPVEKVNTDDVNVVIDYETLKHLMACEYAVEAMLKLSTLSTVVDDTLFINNKGVYGVLKAYVPEDVETRLKELRKEGNHE